MRTRILLGLLLTTLSPLAAQAQLKVHEWGTFTSLVGSNGKTQDGMYHEDEALPDFVYNFGETRRPLFNSFLPQTCHHEDGEKGCIPRHFLESNVITQKMETPIVYFYSDEPVQATVDVRFPEGVISQAYPGPVFTSPTRDSAPVIANGHTVFKVNVLPELQDAAIPAVSAENIYSHARNVASNVVESGGEHEKFIFYRGLGRFQPITQITSSLSGLTVRQPEGQGNIPAAFLVHVDSQGRPALLSLGAINAGTEGAFVSEEDINLLVRSGKRSAGDGSYLGAYLVTALRDAGLNTDEAQAMVDTWTHGYLATPGFRLLYILPRQEVDSILPLTVTPAPQALERVFVGRIEVMLATQEQSLLAEIERVGDLFNAESLGRFAEPTLRRAKEVYLGGKAVNPVMVERLDRLIGEVSTR